ncbi:uncharacterized protein BO72DRAFT_244899 [Aspergillus fijiensis CBS 313.89]|uniref:Uncharacterized protein n=1 Tax=Aspergillus fijiensis CBS 313.89 TaxID=1448319 RepID=A0A8G1RIH0_9EURO|nr:uncharacterized protein BO72DRAFT_244899 [Aspergillus fijiensis CBS 313.89]RAK73303.1 hypothetical protein BO72DRAFT_244899 [Aspergillus fijiensis CBS 313.89]
MPMHIISSCIAEWGILGATTPLQPLHILDFLVIVFPRRPSRPGRPDVFFSLPPTEYIAPWGPERVTGSRRWPQPSPEAVILSTATSNRSKTAARCGSTPPTNQLATNFTTGPVARPFLPYHVA